MRLIDLIILVCASWYVANTITTKSGPWHIFTHLRRVLPLGGLTSCQHCFMIWAAVALLFLYSFGLQIVVVSLGVAGGALMLGSYSGATYVNGATPDKLP